MSRRVGLRLMQSIGGIIRIVGIENVKIGYGTRWESGSQAITGVGFKPKIVLFFAAGTGGAYQMFSHGWSDGVDHACGYSRGHSVNMAVSSVLDRCIHIELTPSEFAAAYVQSMDDDGFTLIWDNAPGLTVDFVYLAMK